MMVHVASRLGLLLLLFVCASVHAAQVSATLDRDRVRMGETVTLNVHAEGVSGSDGPDFSVLRKDFDIVGTSSRTNINIRNGKLNKRTLWAAALRPLHAGVIEIPALSVAGAMTAPLTLTVLGQAVGGHGGPGDDVFVETSIEPGSVYVGEQALLSVRLYYDGALVQGTLDVPQVQGAHLHQLGDDINYRAVRDGRPYRVIERRYALTAHQPGTLTVPGAGFRGQMQAGRSARFFGGGRTVSAVSPEKELVIKPRPAKVADQPWLPAHELTLEMTGLPADGSVEVGVPMTLTLTLRATGLPFESLPELSLPDIPGARVYPNQPVTSTSNDGRWLKGKRQREFALVPTAPGSLTIPEISLPWWNTQTDSAASARIPARTLRVEPAPGMQTSMPGRQTATTTAAGNDVQSTAGGVASRASAPPMWWRIVALIAIALWLLTLLAWWLHRSRATRTPDTRTDASANAATAKRAFNAARDAPTTAATLLAWARAERPLMRNLGELSAELASAGQRTCIAELERHRYADHADAVDIAAVHKAFERGFAWRHNARTKAASGLPPLYPDSS